MLARVKAFGSLRGEWARGGDEKDAHVSSATLERCHPSGLDCDDLFCWRDGLDRDCGWSCHSRDLEFRGLVIAQDRAAGNACTMGVQFGVLTDQIRQGES